jgi:cytochrome c-type biogenesis protein CcmH/NrfF
LLIQFSESSEANALRSALLWQVPFFALITMVLLTWARFKLHQKVS